MVFLVEAQTTVTTGMISWFILKSKLQGITERGKV